MIQTIEIRAREWTDKTYGNSYFSLHATVRTPNRRLTFCIPMVYGYDNSYQYAAMEVVKQIFNIENDNNHTIERWARNNNIVCFCAMERNCKKRDLIPYNRKADEYQYVKGTSTPYIITNDETF
jgi:hypothetical protein